jgi:RNA polymerase subunit RPABC4/transcription elongation factor Spt4
METPATVFSHCQNCRTKLEHTALFCPKCGMSTCSWECYVRHIATHRADAASAHVPVKPPKGSMRAAQREH